MNIPGHKPVEEWYAIDLDSEWAAGFVLQRLDLFFKNDPFVGMFTDDTRRALALLIVSEGVLGEKNLEVKTEKDIFNRVNHALDMSAMGLMLSHQFKIHLITLVTQAVFSGNAENGVLK